MDGWMDVPCPLTIREGVPVARYKPWLVGPGRATYRRYAPCRFSALGVVLLQAAGGSRLLTALEFRGR